MLVMVERRRYRRKFKAGRIGCRLQALGLSVP
jgi:hypothetical protein